MAMDEQAGGRYELLSVLGEGAHAAVYRAWDTALGREVAMKILLPQFAHDADLRARFSNEARRLASLRHPHIVQVYDIAAEGAHPYFTMELIDGRTLDAMLNAGETPTPEGVAAMLAGLCDAVDYLHRAGLVHRDIKATNVMLDKTGRVVLMDFGIVRDLNHDGRTVVGASIGTPETMAPEVILGQPAGPPADIYALGVLAYQLLAGEPPFTGNTAQVMVAQIHSAPPPLWQVRPGLPSALYAVVEAALAKDPSYRPQPAGEFARAFAAALIQPAVVVDPRDGRYPPGAGQERIYAWDGVPVVAILAIILALAAILLSLVLGMFAVLLMPAPIGPPAVGPPRAHAGQPDGERVRAFDGNVMLMRAPMAGQRTAYGAPET